MFEKICEVLDNKNVLILGFGKEGKSTYSFIKKYAHCKSVTIADSKGISIADKNVHIKTGADYQKEIDGFDVIIKSPGIVLENQNESILKKLTSQTELFMMCYRDRTIGITGTKGKSTTSTLLYHILKSKYENCLLIGNIGIPSFDMIEIINSDTIIVYELSAHQLEYIHTSPNISVLINLYPDHLDHYGTYEKYVQAKENIYKYQTKYDVLFCNSKNFPASCEAQVFSVSSDDKNADIFIDSNTIWFNGNGITIEENATSLVGKHNLFNIAIVYGICKRYNVSDKEFLAALKTYTPLAHRLQYIGEYNGVKYYDDSISTICETTIQAMKSLGNIGSVIIGGMDRGIDYTPLCEYLKKGTADYIILIPDSGVRIYKSLQNSSVIDRTVLASDLKDAVEKAKKLTKEGKICLLSPAAASYGFFENFEARGAAFKEYVFSK
ncbi:MAG: UDP-N-acetylmuramoyl-L-alanine--D-glutamate ligase [Clostridia bacterium]|nr:UDP-N-acetylmuramoyl-L-alanine--D-glutamate ligase [Clostridia bacterium]